MSTPSASASIASTKLPRTARRLLLACLMMFAAQGSANAWLMYAMPAMSSGSSFSAGCTGHMMRPATMQGPVNVDHAADSPHRSMPDHGAHSGHHGQSADAADHAQHANGAHQGHWFCTSCAISCHAGMITMSVPASEFGFAVAASPLAQPAVYFYDFVPGVPKRPPIV